MDSATGGAAAAADEFTARREVVTSTIAARRLSHHSLLSSLDPDLAASLSLSLRLISALSHRPLPETLTLTPQRRRPSPHPLPPAPRRLRLTETSDSTPPNPNPNPNPNLLSSLRTAVAVALLEHIPFSDIDSSALLRRLQSNTSSNGGPSSAEKSALAALASSLGNPVLAVETALRNIANDTGAVQIEEFSLNGTTLLMVWEIDRIKLFKELPETPESSEVVVRTPTPMRGRTMGRGIGMHRGKMRSEEDEIKDIEEMINKKTFKELQKSKTGEELLDLIHRPTAKETANAAKFKTKGGPSLKEYCSNLTKEDCRRQSNSFIACGKVHFRRIIAAHTDTNLGDCSFLDTCRHTKTCKYVHYELDQTPDLLPKFTKLRAEYCSEQELGESQWINCDIRSFRMDILGQFGIIMADPPWDIHMELPYGTMADDEMRTLNVPTLQSDGLIFLWVTGRAMELGRECLELWGYKRVEEIIWVKTNQLQRIIRTGRTGHWLNHSKEHCLVGIKGNPLVNRNIDTDVIVAEVRETSRKPDEMYPLLERISPRTRKLELFARMHNTQSGWLSLGNQLPGVRLVDDGLRARYKAAYPEAEVQPASPPRITSSVDVDSNTAQMASPIATPDLKQQVTNSGNQPQPLPTYSK